MSEDLLQKIFEKLVFMERSIKGLETRFERLETRFNGMEVRFDKIEKKVDDNRSEVLQELALMEDRINKRFDKMESILEYHRNKISQNEQDIYLLKIGKAQV